MREPGRHETGFTFFSSTGVYFQFGLVIGDETLRDEVHPCNNF